MSTIQDQVLRMMAVVAFGKAAGLTADETSLLHARLNSKWPPRNIGEMWKQFDDELQDIRASRQHTEE